MSRPVEIGDRELVAAAGGWLVADVESFKNYTCDCFQLVGGPHDGGRVYFEGIDFNRRKLQWLLNNFTIVTFNGNSYDLPMLMIKLLKPDYDEAQLFDVTSELIMGGKRPGDVYRDHGIEPRQAGKVDHVDLINVAFGKASLKLYAGRLHAPHMQDLPYEPYSMLSDDEKAEVLQYCFNDVGNTVILLKELREQLDLRVKMGAQYGVDVRSKSDAQIAESVLGEELAKRTGQRPVRPNVPPGTTFKYRPPDFIAYQTPQLQQMLEQVRKLDFVVDGAGGIEVPSYLKNTKIAMGRSSYTMGIGGLHSNEDRVSFISDESKVYIDQDVASYYPSIILNNQYYPSHLGPDFLDVYQGIVERRLKAKREKDEVTNAALKITINGSFGKLGSKWSILYSPDLMIQVTVTGQLSLLMLIESLEVAGFSVVSANTDGFITEVERSRRNEFEEISADWVKQSGFVLEASDYDAYYARDVSNFVGIVGNVAKTKGCYRPTDDKLVTGHKNQSKSPGLSKNPAGDIIYEAVVKCLLDGTPVEETIRACNDVRKFVFVQQVKTGAVKDGEYLGKVVRWYHAKGDYTALKYRGSGNKVAKSGGGKPMMTLTTELPDDLDYDFYVREAEKHLRDDFSKPADRQLSLF